MNFKKIKKETLDILENTKFPITKSRKNIIEENKGIEAFALGDVNYRGQAILDYKTKGPSKYNKKFPLLYNALNKLIKEYDQDFKFTTIQVNKNVMSRPHIDKNNVGPSCIIGLGDYEYGKLVIEGKEYNIKNRFKKFDGRLGHWITPFKGTRYSIIYFNHTFKPPCPSLRGIEVKKNGLYKNGELIKKYNYKDKEECH